MDSKFFVKIVVTSLPIYECNCCIAGKNIETATRDKSNIFTRDDYNHTWYFPIFFASHILISHCRSTSITTVVHQYYQQNLSEKGQHSTWSGPLIHYWQQLMACSRNLSLPSKQLVFRRWLSVRIPFGLFLWGDHLDA